MSRYLRATLGESFGYTPGEQPPDGERWVKLNTNESALPPSPRVAEAVAVAAAALNRYPSPVGEPLRSRIAAYHGVSAEQVVLGNGADGVLAAIFAAFCDPGAAVVLTEPTYSLLPTLSRLHGADVRTVALEADGELPAELASTPAALRFLVNPNTPTGTWRAPTGVAAALAGAAGVAVIDEAYCDFAPASCIPLLAEHPSWLVVRTFSKSYALAGLRVGYAVGSADLVADVLAAGDSYPIDRCAMAGAVAALDDQDHHRVIVASVLRERARLATALAELGWQLTDSHANFLCGRPRSTTAGEVADELRARHILVRRFASGDAGMLRITVGSPRENDALLAALQ